MSMAEYQIVLPTYKCTFGKVFFLITTRCIGNEEAAIEKNFTKL